jgi:hypothetical protein
MRIFENEIIPVLQMMTQSQAKSSHLDYHIGVRMMKLSILIINNLGIGVNLMNLILSETEGIFSKQSKEPQMHLTWRSLLAFEGLAIIMNNPNLIQLFSQCALQVGKTLLAQIFECLSQVTTGDNLDLNGEGSQKHIMTNPHYSQ